LSGQLLRNQYSGLTAYLLSYLFIESLDNFENKHVMNMQILLGQLSGQLLRNQCPGLTAYLLSYLFIESLDIFVKE
jgi:hypothetical protein